MKKVLVLSSQKTKKRPDSMLNLETLTACLGCSLSRTNIVILFEILKSFLCISHGGGVRTLSRYTSMSERTLFRFLAKTINWKPIFVKIFHTFIYSKQEVYLLVADETIERKAGKYTSGIDTFYSSILKMCVRSLNLFGFSLVEISSKKSSFLGFEQVKYTSQNKERIANTKAKKLFVSSQNYVFLLLYISINRAQKAKQSPKNMVVK